jgi:hypothetical protein
MKNLFLIPFLTLFTLSSCKDEVADPIELPIVEELVAVVEPQIICYQGIVKKDTFNLRLKIDKNQEIKGELAYLFFEKDRSNGTFVGKLSGDTLKANYTFTSQGKESSKEIVFLRKGKIIIEAYGEIEEHGGKTVFKEPKKLYFDSATVLSEIDCPEVK